MGTATDGAAQALVDRYIARFEEYAAQLGPIRRFYAYMADDLQGLEWEALDLDPTEQRLHDALKRLYSRWLEDMTPGERQDLFVYNRQQRGEWRSHILEEELEELYTTHSAGTE